MLGQTFPPQQLDFGTASYTDVATPKNFTFADWSFHMQSRQLGEEINTWFVRYPSQKRTEKRQFKGWD